LGEEAVKIPRHLLIGLLKLWKIHAGRAISSIDRENPGWLSRPGSGEE
jgi:hypothetical protein